MQRDDDPYVVLPFNGELYAFTQRQLEGARERARELVPSTTQGAGATETMPTVVDAKGAEVATGVPARWWLDAARAGRVPYVRFGHYVRFDLGEVLAHARVGPGRAQASRQGRVRRVK